MTTAVPREKIISGGTTFGITVYHKMWRKQRDESWVTVARGTLLAFRSPKLKKGGKVVAQRGLGVEISNFRGNKKNGEVSKRKLKALTSELL